MKHFPTDSFERLRTALFVTKAFVILLMCLVACHQLAFTNNHLGDILISYALAVLTLFVGGMCQLLFTHDDRGFMNIAFGICALLVLSLLLPTYNA